MRTNSKYHGFTILELLLVIAILGILTTYYLSYFQQRTQDVKINRATQQIQELLQAASSFYLKYGHWRTSCADANFIPFIPTGSTLNPWGTNKPYICQPTTSGKKFQIISIQLPVYRRVLLLKFYQNCPMHAFRVKIIVPALLIVVVY